MSLIYGEELSYLTTSLISRHAPMTKRPLIRLILQSSNETDGHQRGDLRLCEASSEPSVWKQHAHLSDTQRVLLNCVLFEKKQG